MELVWETVPRSRSSGAKAAVSELGSCTRLHVGSCVHCKSEKKMSYSCMLIADATLYLRQFTCTADILSRQRLRSSTTDSLFVPAVSLSTVGRHAFPVAGACMWNDLPSLVTSSPSLLVRALDSRSAGYGFDSRPLHCRATTLGKLFTPICLCSPSSIIWYLARAFMIMCLYVAAMHGSNEQGEYCSSGSAVISRLLRTTI